MKANPIPKSFLRGKHTQFRPQTASSTSFPGSCGLDDPSRWFIFFSRYGRSLIFGIEFNRQATTNDCIFSNCLLFFRRDDLEASSNDTSLERLRKSEEKREKKPLPSPKLLHYAPPYCTRRDGDVVGFQNCTAFGLFYTVRRKTPELEEK